jgi:UDP-N-acetylmuramate dehydrogenase
VNFVKSNVELASYTSWQIGGRADLLAEPRTLDELRAVYLESLKNKTPISILGGGSNVLISDAGVRGLTLCLSELKNYQISEVDFPDRPARFVLVAETGVAKSELLKVFLKAKLPPALFLAGIPGDVGGGVAMNAGVSEAMVPREFTEIIDWIEVLKPSGELVRYAHEQLEWSYRHSDGWQPGIIFRVQFSWAKDIDAKIIDRVREANRTRLTKQPLELPSCGSVFMNPPGQKAAQLIDRCGLKGARIGQAQVSLKHANFIVNLGGASATDTWNLMLQVQRTVLEKEKVQLRTEVVRLGDWD